jgi:hypothetical protein
MTAGELYTLVGIRLRGLPGDPRGRHPGDRRPAGGWSQERGGLTISKVIDGADDDTKVGCKLA